MLIEIIATSAAEAKLAESYGADRIELIHAFDLGGLSPTLQLSKNVCEAVTIPVNVMLRPHGKNFIYDDVDFKQIIQELEFIRDNTKANGIVFGALTADGLIDHKLLREIIKNKGHLKLTFHRAIDVTADIFVAYMELLEYNDINLILTSGGKNTAIDGANVIQKMVEVNKAQEYCKILTGSGITPDNAKALIKITKTQQIHLGTGVRENNILSKAKFDKLLAEVK